jgi:hypothetical protein
MAKLSKEMIAIIGRNNAAFYDFIFPHGPLDRFAAVAINPQPFPPVAFGREMAHHFARNLAFASRFGLDGKGLLGELDDWCPTKPRKIKLPKGLKWPPPPPPDPEPGPDWLVGLHMGFATELSTLEGTFSDKASQKLMASAIDRSIGVINEAVPG